MDFDAKIKELTENANKFQTAYLECMGAIKFLVVERDKQKSNKDKKEKDK